MSLKLLFLRVLLAGAVVLLGYIIYEIQTRSSARPPPLSPSECEQAKVAFVKLSDGRLITYNVYGSEEGDPVVLIGGIPSASQSFAPLSKLFSDLNVRYTDVIDHDAQFC